MMEKTLYPKHPLRCIKTGPSNSGKTVFLTNLILNNTDKYIKINIYSPSLQQDIHQILFRGFFNFIPFHIIPNIVNEEDIGVVVG